MYANRGCKDGSGVQGGAPSNYSASEPGQDTPSLAREIPHTEAFMGFFILKIYFLKDYDKPIKL